MSWNWYSTFSHTSRTICVHTAKERIYHESSITVRHKDSKAIAMSDAKWLMIHDSPPALGICNKQSSSYTFYVIFLVHGIALRETIGRGVREPSAPV